jgi:hypothetical protein
VKWPTSCLPKNQRRFRDPWPGMFRLSLTITLALVQMVPEGKSVEQPWPTVWLQGQGPVCGFNIGNDWGWQNCHILELILGTRKNPQNQGANVI